MTKRRAARSQNEAIAIVGMGCRFPKASDPQTFWRNIRDGVDAITDIPSSHWSPADYYDGDPNRPDMTYGRRGGFLEPTMFDPMEFGIPPRDLEATDTTQLLGLLVAKEALSDAGYGDGGKAFDRSRTSVILGVTGALELVIPLGARLGHPIWQKALEDAGVDTQTSHDVMQRIQDAYVPWQENSFPGLLGNVAAGRIANRLDLHGTNCVVDAACASSLSAAHLAILELQSGRSDMVLTGGLDTFNDIFMYMCFSKTPALSPTGEVRPFDQQGDGTILGEGLGIVVLKRLSDAQRDEDRIYAVIRGIGTSSDGKGTAIYAPNAAGQARALRSAYKEANIDPKTVELIEAHGTGTKVGDATEVRGLTEVYRDAAASGTWCALGSVKSMIGHTKAAAGAAGLIKATLALHHGVLPPTLKVQQPNEAIGDDTPFYINRTKRPWLNNGHPRRAGLSAFGFGGSNFHCVLEQAPDTEEKVDWSGDVQIVALGGDSPEALEAQLDTLLASQKTREPWNSWRRAARQSRHDFDTKSAHRLVFTLTRAQNPAARIQEAKQALATNRTLDFWRTPHGIFGAHAMVPGKLGALFAGQGAQYVNMGRDLACQFPQMRRALEAAQTHTPLDLPLRDVIYPPAAFGHAGESLQSTALRQTAAAQPAIGAIATGMLNVLVDFGIDFAAAAGHSYGELVALHAMGHFDETTLHRLSGQRGQHMSGGSGAMLAVMAERSVVDALISKSNLDVVVANHNTTQVVVSGSQAGIDAAQEAFATAGLRTIALSVIQNPGRIATSAFADDVQDVSWQPGKPIYSNTTAQPYPEDRQAKQEILAHHLAQPVDFVGILHNMYAEGVRTFVVIPAAVSAAWFKKPSTPMSHALPSMHPPKRMRGNTILAKAPAFLAARGGHAVALEPGTMPPQHPERTTRRPPFNSRAPTSGSRQPRARKGTPLTPPQT
ncbi:MAG: beta-ketoacyl synthase N-terminal-like domain-containing protein [Myxococcota bacterium]